MRSEFFQRQATVRKQPFRKSELMNVLDKFDKFDDLYKELDDIRDSTKNNAASQPQFKKLQAQLNYSGQVKKDLPTHRSLK